ncbi:hypothetical protein BHX98_20460 [Acinetobacter baumannii]|nr:hypothetical protein BHX98_20460 [Acinetobacter baumannii]
MAARIRPAQLGDGLAVIDLSGGLDSIGAIAEVDLVDVQLEDLVFAQLSLDLQGQQNFVDLREKLRSLVRK